MSEQMIYTSCAMGESGSGSGLQVYSSSSGLKKTDASEMSALSKYEKEGLNLPNIPEDGNYDIYPQSFRYYSLSDGRTVVSKSTYLGWDYSKTRVGTNYVAHAITFDANTYPILAMKSASFVTSTALIDVSSTKKPVPLPQIELDTTNSPFSIEDIFRFVETCDKKMLYALISLVIKPQAPNVNLVVKIEEAPLWLAAVTMSFPVNIAKKIFFSTFEVKESQKPGIFCFPDKLAPQLRFAISMTNSYACTIEVDPLLERYVSVVFSGKREEILKFMSDVSPNAAVADILDLFSVYQSCVCGDDDQITRAFNVFKQCYKKIDKGLRNRYVSKVLALNDSVMIDFCLNNVIKNDSELTKIYICHVYDKLNEAVTPNAAQQLYKQNRQVLIDNIRSLRTTGKCGDLFVALCIFDEKKSDDISSLVESNLNVASSEDLDYVINLMLGSNLTMSSLYLSDMKMPDNIRSILIDSDKATLMEKESSEVLNIVTGFVSKGDDDFAVSIVDGYSKSPEFTDLVDSLLNNPTIKSKNDLVLKIVSCYLDHIDLKANPQKAIKFVNSLNISDKDFVLKKLVISVNDNISLSVKPSSEIMSTCKYICDNNLPGLSYIYTTENDKISLVMISAYLANGTSIPVSISKPLMIANAEEVQSLFRWAVGNTYAKSMDGRWFSSVAPYFEALPDVLSKYVANMVSFADVKFSNTSPLTDLFCAVAKSNFNESEKDKILKAYYKLNNKKVNASILKVAKSDNTVKSAYESVFGAEPEAEEKSKPDSNVSKPAEKHLEKSTSAPDPKSVRTFGRSHDDAPKSKAPKLKMGFFKK